MTTSSFRFPRRALLALAVLALPLAASQCGSSDPTPQQKTAVSVVYSVRYAVIGVGTQPYVDRPYVEPRLLQCAPVVGQATAGGACANEQGVAYIGTITSNTPATTVPLDAPLNIAGSLSGQTVYLAVWFYSAKYNPPGTNTTATVELLGDGKPVQAVTLTGADDVAANRYADGTGTGNYYVLKYAKVVLP